MKKLTPRMFLMLYEIKLFNLRFKKLLFFSGEPLRVFHHCFFRCFYFTIVFTIVFGCFHCWLHLLTSLFTSLHFTIVMLYRECYGFERAFFTLRRFLPYTPSPHLPQYHACYWFDRAQPFWYNLAQPAFINSSLGTGSSWRSQGL